MLDEITETPFAADGRSGRQNWNGIGTYFALANVEAVQSTLGPCLASGVVPGFGSLQICSLSSCLLHGLALLFLSLISSWIVFQIHP